MESLIHEAFLHTKSIGKQVVDVNYDLIGPDNEVISPQVWETMVKPNMSVSMHMRSMPEPPLKEKTISPEAQASLHHDLQKLHVGGAMPEEKKKSKKDKGVGLSPPNPLPYPPGDALPASVINLVKSSQKGRLECGNVEKDTDHYVNTPKVRTYLSLSQYMIEQDSFNIDKIDDAVETAELDEFSDVDTIDEPIELSDDLQNLDMRLTDSIKWQSDLDTLEKTIVMRSMASRLSEENASTQSTTLNYCLYSDLDEDNFSKDTSIAMLQNAIESLEILQRGGYSTEGFSSLLLQPNRKDVVALVYITKAQINTLVQALTEEDLKPVLSFLAKTGLSSCLGVFHDISEDRLLQYTARFVAKFVNLAIVTYAGAHLERFDEKYFGISYDCFKIYDGLVLRRRSLKCLGGYLHGNQVWVFEESHDVQPLESVTEPLYLLTTAAILADIWGPVWMVKDQRCDEDILQVSKFSTTASETSPGQTGPCRIKQFNIGLGSIIPATSEKQSNSNSPPLRSGETLAHWTDHQEEIHHSRDTYFPDVDGTFLIGGGSILQPQKSCPLTAENCRKEFWQQGRISHFGTKNSIVEVKTEAILMINPPFLKVGGSAKFKKREGSTLKEALLSVWMNQPQKRDPSIVRHHLGVEISACTANARRIRLARLLASKGMRNYFDRICFHWPDECRDRYFEALNDRYIGSFERLYSNNPEWRSYIGDAVRLSLDILIETGTDAEKNFRAVWIPNKQDLWMTKFSQKDQQWAGLLSDTRHSCAVGIVSATCLEFMSGRWPSKCHLAMPNSVSQMKQSVLETKIIINKKNALAMGLTLSRKDENYPIMELQADTKLDLGDSGRLTFISWLHNKKRAVFKWEKSNPVHRFIGMIWSHSDVSHHWEQVMDLDLGPLLPICVVSNLNVTNRTKDGFVKQSDWKRKQDSSPDSKLDQIEKVNSPRKIATPILEEHMTNHEYTKSLELPSSSITESTELSVTTSRMLNNSLPKHQITFGNFAEKSKGARVMESSCHQLGTNALAVQYPTSSSTLVRNLEEVDITKQYSRNGERRTLLQTKDGFLK
jgi:hypothetical protein